MNVRFWRYASDFYGGRRRQELPVFPQCEVDANGTFRLLRPDFTTSAVGVTADSAPFCSSKGGRRICCDGAEVIDGTIAAPQTGIDGV
jgi:hypothetical protein